MPNSPNDRTVPDATFPVRVEDAWQQTSSDVLFKGRTVVAFALPGALMPNCFSTHLPRCTIPARVFKANGVYNFFCLPVHDLHVAQAWQAGQIAEDICRLPDGAGEFSAGPVGLHRAPWPGTSAAVKECRT